MPSSRQLLLGALAALTTPVIQVIPLPAASASEIDFDSIPSCARNGTCFPYHSSFFGCQSFTKSCFCNAFAPVNCSGTACMDNDWYAVEDWYYTQCPGDPKNVTLSGMPACSRRCIREALMPQYCRSQLTQNCFCRLQNVFMGLTTCLTTGCLDGEDQARETLAAYYRKTCVYTPSVDGNGKVGGSADEEVVQAPIVAGGGGDSGGPQDDKEKLYTMVGLISGLLTLGGVVLSTYICISRRRAVVSPAHSFLLSCAPLLFWTVKD